jgi:hypothetical protein
VAVKSPDLADESCRVGVPERHWNLEIQYQKIICDEGLWDVGNQNLTYGYQLLTGQILSNIERNNL